MPTPPRSTVEHVVRAACLAPSVHNTQPWLFAWRTGALEVRADRTRQLAVLDPYGRQLLLSCGAAVHHAGVAARGLGLSVDQELFPDPDEPDLLARLRLRPGRAPSPREQALAVALLDRHTHRGAFDDGPLEESVVAALTEAVEGQGAALRTLRDEDDLIALQVLLARADAEEARDPAYWDELRRWAGPGIPETALGSSVVSSLTPRVFPGTPVPDLTDPPEAEHPDVLVVVTDNDGPVDWLVAGQALSALLLCGASYGVMAQPLGQATDRDAYRLRLRSALGLVGCPQMVLRMGQVAVAGAATPRRAVDDVLRFPVGVDR